MARICSPVVSATCGSTCRDAAPKYRALGGLGGMGQALFCVRLDDLVQATRPDGPCFAHVRMRAALRRIVGVGVGVGVACWSCRVRCV